jgi:hypothetical protein
MSNQLPFAAMLHSTFSWTKEEKNGQHKSSTFTFARTGAVYLLLEHSENIFHILLPLSLTQLKVEVMKQQLKLPM